MSRSALLTTIVVAVILVLGGWWVMASMSQQAAVTDNNADNTVGEESNQGSNPNATEQPSSEPSNLPETSSQPETITVKYTDNGFQPASVGTIKAGDTVKFVNESGDPLEVASDPHPSHTNYPGFESNNLSEGQSYNFTFDRTGTWGFHNHFNASHKGSVTVE